MNRIVVSVFILSLVALGCADSECKKNGFEEIEKLKIENDSLRNALIKNELSMKKQIATFLTFQDNNAEKAMIFYVELFDNSKIIDVQYWGKDAPVAEGGIMSAKFVLDGNLFMCSDSPPIHDWGFTPAVSNFVECDTESQLESFFEKLSENGTVTMPLGNYGFSSKFAWVIDQFGISWQLNLN